MVGVSDGWMGARLRIREEGCRCEVLVVDGVRRVVKLREGN
jgi:hypothetical protein